MPNVVLEALMANLFVIAPAVGGIPEVIEDNVNGSLVVDNLTYHEYLQKILIFYQDENMLSGRNGQRMKNDEIISRHSQKEYSRSVQKLYKLQDR